MPYQEGKGGKYDDEAEAVLQQTGGVTVILMVLGGPKGHGFSVASRAPLKGCHVSELLRSVAEGIERGAPPDGVRVTLKGEERGRS